MSDEITIDGSLIDRLVDGELAGPERRELLERLERSDDGWRRCALAFLEAQSWGRELKLLATQPAPAVVAKTSHADAGSKDGSSKRTAAGWLTLAAGLLVAFTLGWSLRFGGGPEAEIAGSPEPSQIAEVEPDGNEGLVDDSRPPDAQSELADRPDDGELVTFWARDAQGRPQSLNVPLVDAETLDPQWGTRFQSAIPDSLRQKFEELGYQVNSRRRYAPLWVEGSRPMIVPVEDTQIVPVSQTVF